MEKSIKFTLAIDNLNKKIANLNIKISKDPYNDDLKKQLTILLEDKNTLYKGTDLQQLENLINKYGSNE